MPASDTTRVAIVGAGAGGLGLGILLRRAGFDDFVILEKTDGVGGTWRVNTYPGAECDVPSHLYSFSFMLNPGWTKTFPGQAEILRYFERCCAEAGVGDRLRTGTAVTRIEWSDDDRHWRLHTEAGDTLAAQVVVSAVGMFNEPNVPAIDGLGDFAGPVIHSARWDHGVELAGRRVGVIGTGASAIQIVPAIVDDVAHLTVFQRTPPWIFPRGDKPFTAAQRARFAADVEAMRAERQRVHDLYEANTLFRLDDPRAGAFEAFGRAHLESSVADPALRARLTPDYPVGCSRILLSDDYYPAIARDDVALVTDPITRITPGSVLTAPSDGVESAHDLDVLVLATGFRATEYLHGLDVVGRGGRRLHDVWGGEPRAYLGMAVPGYPNFFMFYGPNTNQSGNSILLILEAEANYVIEILRSMEREGTEVVEVRRDAFVAYNEELDRDLDGTVWSAGCHNYFRTPSGHIATQLPHPSAWYVAQTRTPRLEDFEMVPGHASGDF